MSKANGLENIVDYICDYIDDEQWTERAVWEQIEVTPTLYDHPAVARARIAIDAAQRTAVALVARDLEGLLGREIEKRRGEAAVAMLAKVLGLVDQPADEDVHVNHCAECGEPIPQWGELETTYREGYFCSQECCAKPPRSTVDSTRALRLKQIAEGAYRDGLEHRARLDAECTLPMHKQARAVAEGPRWRYESTTDTFIGRHEHEDLYWQPDIDRVGCVWNDGRTHGGYMRDTLMATTEPCLVRVREMLDAHLEKTVDGRTVCCTDCGKVVTKQPATSPLLCGECVEGR